MNATAATAKATELAIATALRAHPSPGTVRTPLELSAALDGVLALVGTLTNIILPVDDLPAEVFTLTGTIKGRLSGLIIDAKYLRTDGPVSLGALLGNAAEKVVSL